MFDYAPHGHEPAMVYDVPHFDLHYYFTASSEREAITPSDMVKSAIQTASQFSGKYYPTLQGFIHSSAKKE